MAQKTVPPDDDLLEYARRMEKHFEAFQYLREVLQAARDAKANMPKYKAEAEVAEQAKNEAVATSNAEVLKAQVNAKTAQAEYDAKVKALDTAFEKKQTLHNGLMTKLESDGDAAAEHFESEKAKHAVELGETEVQAEKADFEKQKAAMTQELADLKAAISRTNQMMISQREAVLALRPTALSE